MIDVITDFKLEGVETTLPFGKWAMEHPEFIKGNLSTNFIKDYYQPRMLQPELTIEEEKVAAVMAVKAFRLSNTIPEQ